MEAAQIQFLNKDSNAWSLSSLFILFVLRPVTGLLESTETLFLPHSLYVLFSIPKILFSWISYLIEMPPIQRIFPKESHHYTLPHATIIYLTTIPFLFTSFINSDIYFIFAYLYFFHLLIVCSLIYYLYIFLKWKLNEAESLLCKLLSSPVLTSSQYSLNICWVNKWTLYRNDREVTHFETELSMSCVKFCFDTH